MATSIRTVTSRERLKPRREPYWAPVSAGCHLGYRKMSASTAGTWVAKYRDATTGQRVKRSLGDFGEVQDAMRFDAAVKVARDWFEHLGKGGSADAVTVADACRRYVAHVRDRKGERAAEDARSRFASYVLDNKNLAATELQKLTPVAVDSWRRALAARPTKSGGSRGEKRTASTLNRDMTCFRAALNLAHLEGLVTSDFAWRAKLRPVKGADKKRETYLTRDQRRALIDAAAPDLALFLRGLALLPLRPGALAALTVSDFDVRLGVLRVGTDKANAERRIKLPASTKAWFVERSLGKLPAAPLMTRADGKRWNKDAWKWPVREAVTAAQLPATTTAYTLRHSTITDLVHDGLDLLTVAQLSGTSLRMIEAHYGHLTGNRAAEALERLVL